MSKGESARFCCCLVGCSLGQSGYGARRLAPKPEDASSSAPNIPLDLSRPGTEAKRDNPEPCDAPSCMRERGSQAWDGRCLGDPPLIFGVEVEARAVLRAAVAPLLVQSGWVVALPEDLQQLLVGHDLPEGGFADLRARDRREGASPKGGPRLRRPSRNLCANPEMSGGADTAKEGK